MSETILLVAGCIVFATVTVATLLYGYTALNRAWLADDVANTSLPLSLPLPVSSSFPAVVPLAVVPIPVLSPD